MPFLVAGLVLVGTVCAIDLVLTLAVLRRLREHTERLGQLAGTGNLPAGVDRTGLIGRGLPEFTATTADGATVSTQTLTGAVELVGFFAPGCAPCHVQAPVFATEAGGRTLALIAGSGAGADELVGMLKGAGTVVAAPDSMTLIEALNITSFPTILRLDPTGTVVDAAVSVRGLTALDRR